ncbi:MAG: hypothetical protein CVT89_08220, partial [Candidatus Altiarchaeales archaeon HGW-Altiarchaeales-2]
CPKDNLAVNESMTCNCTTTLTQCGNVTNIADVTAIDNQNNTVTASDNATVEVICNASIDINKTANATQINVSDSVTYYYNVTNTGNLNLANINVTDDRCAPVICPKDNLAVNESMLCNCSTALTTCGNETNSNPPTDFCVPVCGNVTNIATVTANDLQGNNVSNTDNATVEVICNVGISIDKIPNTPKINAGENVTYYYYLTNTGNVVLTNISISDDKCNPVICPKTTLEPTTPFVVVPPMECNCTTTLTQCGNVTNIATVTANDPQGNNVSNTDNATVEVICNASININKTANATQINVSDSVTYYYNVTNTGNLDLTNINVTDDRCADNQNNTVTASDNATVEVICNATCPLSLVKFINSSEVAKYNDTVEFCMNITNTGDSIIHADVLDILPDQCLEPINQDRDSLEWIVFNMFPGTTVTECFKARVNCNPDENKTLTNTVKGTALLPDGSTCETNATKNITIVRNCEILCTGCCCPCMYPPEVVVTKKILNYTSGITEYFTIRR